MLFGRQNTILLNILNNLLWMGYNQTKKKRICKLLIETITTFLLHYVKDAIY